MHLADGLLLVACQGRHRRLKVLPGKRLHPDTNTPLKGGARGEGMRGRQRKEGWEEASRTRTGGAFREGGTKEGRGETRRRGRHFDCCTAEVDDAMAQSFCRVAEGGDFSPVKRLSSWQLCRGRALQAATFG